MGVMDKSDLLKELRIDRGAVEAAVQLELERDLGRSQRVGRRHGVQSGDARKLPLQRRGDGGGRPGRFRLGSPVISRGAGRLLSGRTLVMRD